MQPSFDVAVAEGLRIEITECGVDGHHVEIGRGYAGCCGNQGVARVFKESLSDGPGFSRTCWASQAFVIGLHSKPSFPS